jgi:hypothetical protein
VIVDPAQDVGEPSLRIEVVEFRRADQGVHRRGALATAIGADEQPSLAPEGDTVGLASTGILDRTGKVWCATVSLLPRSARSPKRWSRLPV